MNKKYYKINYHGSSVIVEGRKELIDELELLLGELIELESEYHNERDQMVEQVIYRGINLSDKSLVGELYNYNNIIIAETVNKNITNQRRKTKCISVLKVF